MTLVLGVFGVAASSAQDLETDRMPSRPIAERIVSSAAVAPSLPSARVEATTNVEVAGGQDIVRTALQYIGARYRSGASGPSAFDCSGFTSYVYGKQNIPILRSSRSQFTQGRAIDEIADLKKGDLVFFGGSRASRSVGHVGIVTEVADDGSSFKFVHAARTGVQVDNSNSAYYSRRYLGARRILGE